VSKQYARALPKTSVTDLVQALKHDLELARGKGQHTAICLLDVKGGFNNVWHSLLLKRLENLRFANWVTK